MKPAPVKVGPTAEVKTVMAAKKETSRIPLEAAAPATPGVPAGKATEGPKTIRIKPAAAIGATKIGVSALKAPAPVVAAVAAPDEKRKTSRISLEAAFASEEASKPGDGPKTIKLKRPSEATTIKVGPKVTSASTDESTGDSNVLGKTARLDLPPAEEDEGPSPTRKKTIRIKRPGGEEHLDSGTEDGSGERPAPAMHPAFATAPVTEEDDTSWVFPALSFVAILVMALLIYVIMATGLVADLGWIGKVAITR